MLVLDWLRGRSPVQVAPSLQTMFGKSSVAMGIKMVDMIDRLAHPRARAPSALARDAQAPAPRAPEGGGRRISAQLWPRPAPGARGERAPARRGLAPRG